MSDFMNTFTTTTSEEFKWPCPLPVKIIPSKPPKNTGKRFYLPRIDPDECNCNIHSVETNLTKYKQCVRQEQKLCQEIVRINQNMTNLITDMLDHPDSSQENVMHSVYQVAYGKRGKDLNEYRDLMAAVDALVQSPITPVISKVQIGYRDPTNFRYSLIETPHIGQTQSIDFQREPEGFSLWTDPIMGRTEYMDTISKLGLANTKNQQQYLEPLPSSRRRWGDCAL